MGVLKNDMKKIELTLPEWAFLDAYSHEGNLLGDRTVILHVRSASVIEIFDRDVDNIVLKDSVLTYKFGSKRTGERLMAALHYSATIDDDRELLKEMLRNCAIWYIDYTDWEDKQFGLNYDRT